MSIAIHGQTSAAIIVLDDNQAIGLRQQLHAPLGPFNKTHAPAVKIIPESQLLEFFRIIQPIQVKMINVTPFERVGFQQCVGGALDRPAMTQ